MTRQHIERCPAGGEGVHLWLMQSAWRLKADGHSAPKAADWLERNMTRQPTPRNEIQSVISKVFGQSGGGLRQARMPAKWPPLNVEQREAAIAEGVGMVDLWEASPIRFEIPSTEGILSALFPGECLLCMARDQRSAQTKPHAAWRGHMEHAPLMVPSPMRAAVGKTQDGRTSARCLGNTGTRRFLVCEFDRGTLDEQAACIAHLAAKGPMVMCLHSGGKSLHAWFTALGTPEPALRNFFARACSLGADPATWSRCQMVRTPDACRDNGCRQAVYYFNPANIPLNK
jgi:hypothetical protein